MSNQRNHRSSILARARGFAGPAAPRAGIAALVAAALGLADSPSVRAQSEDPPCSGEEYRQLDFWVGVWDLEFTAPDGSVGRAENRITRDEYGGCVISEYFRYPGGAPPWGDFIGTSRSVYDRQTRTWRQMWVDNEGNVFDLRGGPVAGQLHIFELVNIEPRGPDATLRRMIWEDVAPDSLTWRWQRRQADQPWADLWVIRYSRRREPR